jgi:hypothetical protein
MLKLCQAIALETGVRNKTYARLNERFKALQAKQAISGLSRTYEPLNDDGETEPPQITLVQVAAEPTLAAMAAELVRQWNITATRDWGNTVATGTVTIDGQALLADAPVPYLLFLQKQLTDWRDVILKTPVHPAEDRWYEDPSTGVWRSDTVTTNRTKKVPRNHVVAPATDKHPAQVQVYHEDQVIGHYQTTKFTGSIPADRKTDLLRRVEQLQEAVIKARQDANATEVRDQHPGAPLLSFLLGSPVSASSASD